MKISRTYSRKLNLRNYGGNQYETCDFSATYESDTEERTDVENLDLHKMSEDLFKMAKSDVEQSIAEEIELIKKNTAPF